MTKKTNFKRQLFASASVLAMGAFAASGANAASVPAAASTATNLTFDTNSTGLSGTTLTLTGIHTNAATSGSNHMIWGAGADGLTLHTGAFAHTVGGTNAASDWVTTSANTTGSLTVTAGGSISTSGATGGQAIDLDHNFGTITNNGTIQSTANDLDVITIAAATVAGFINNASISANGTGEAIKTGGATVWSTGFLNASTGKIVTTGAGVPVDLSGGTATFTAGGLTNNGSIGSGGTTAALNLAGVTSQAVGTASTIATSAANGVIYNTGTISGTISTGAVTVAGVIDNQGASSTFSMANSVGTGAGIYNAGQITDTTGIAMLVTGGGTGNTSATSTDIYNASTGLIGATTTAATGISFTTANYGGNLLNAGSIYTTSATGINLTAVSVGAIKNIGTISSTAGKGINLSNSANSAITSLTNSGLITDTTTGNAIEFAGAAGTTTITNSGTISAQTTGIGIKFTGAAALAGTVTINNTGTISSAGTAANTGAIFSGAATAATAVINNTTGTISSAPTAGTGGTIYIAAAGALGLITNAGTITSGNTSGGTSYTHGGSTNVYAINAANSAVATAVNLTNTGYIAGSIHVGTGGTNTVRMNATNTFTSTTSAISGNQVTGNIVLGSETSDTVQFNPGSGTTQWYQGTIGAGLATPAIGSGKGDVVITSGTNTLTASGTGALNIDTLTIASGAELYLNGQTSGSTQTTTGLIDETISSWSGTLHIGNKNTLTAASTITQSTGAVLKFDVTNVSASSTIAGQLSSTGAATTILKNHTSSSIEQAVQVNYTNTSGTYQSATTGTGSTSTGTDLHIIDNTTGTITWSGIGSTVATGYSLTDNSYTLKFTAYLNGASGTATDAYVNISRENTYQSSSGVVNTKAVGTALETIANNSGNTALHTIQATLDAYSTAAEVESALKTLDNTTSTSGQTTMTTIAAQDAALGNVESRLDVALYDSNSGVATGGRMNTNGVWGQVFGTSVNQDDRKNVTGYDGNTVGFSLGADTAITNQARIGGAFAYGRTETDGTRNDADVDSYQGTLYGSYDAGKLYYEGLAAFTYNDYDTTRTLFDGTVATAGFAGQQYTAKAAANYKLDGTGTLKVTPFVSAQYTLVVVDDYTESGSNAPLHVETDNVNIFKTGLGVKLALPIVEGGLTYTPRATAAWYYDLVGDEIETTSNFTSATGTRFISKGADIAQSSYRLGAGLDIMAQDNVTVSLDYKWDAKADYDSHTGELKARFEF